MLELEYFLTVDTLLCNFRITDRLDLSDHNLSYFGLIGYSNNIKLSDIQYYSSKVPTSIDLIKRIHRNINHKNCKEVISVIERKCMDILNKFD